MNLKYKYFILNKVRFFSPDQVDKIYGIDDKNEKKELLEKDKEKIIKESENRKNIINSIREKEAISKKNNDPDDWLDKKLNNLEDTSVIINKKNIDNSSKNYGNAGIEIGQ